MSNDLTLRSTALALDASDPLAEYRNEFMIADPSLCYLDGNSLGRMPKEVINVVGTYLRDEWATKLVSGWS
jgi:kynureninase